MENAQKTKKTLLQGLEIVSQHLPQPEQVEQTLEESKEEYERLFDILPIGITILDLKGVTKYCNPAVYDKSGYPEGEFTGKHFSKISSVRIKDTPRYLRLFNSIIRGKTPKPFEALYQRKDGTTGWTELNISLMKVGGKRRILVMQHDITERKRAEETLKESEEKFSKAFNAASDAMCILSSTTSLFLDVNDSYTKISGYTRDELIGHNPDELGMWARPEDRARSLRLLKENGRLDQEEFALRTKTGEIKTCLFSTAPITVGAERHNIVVVQDITERKRAEEALADEATRRRILIDQSRDGIVIIDRDGHVYEANQRFADMLGYSTEELHRLSVFDWEYSFPRDAVIEMLRTVDESGDHFETSHRRKDGSIYDVEISTNAAIFAGQKLIFCVCRDITERKEAEEKLKESEEKFAKAFSASANAICILSLPGSEFVEINDSFTRFTGYSREELVGRTAAELKIWANPETLEQLKNVVKKEGKFTNFEFHARRKSGEIRVGLSSAEVINISGKPHRIVAITDITERQKAEEALKESEEKFAKAFSASANAICIVSLQDNKFVEINDSYSRFTGYSREEVIGHTAVELKIWANPAELERLQNVVEKDGKFINFEFHARSKSGEIRVGLSSAEVINISGKPHRIVAITDITERKQAEEKLQHTLADLEQSSIRLEAANKELEAFSYSVSHDLRSPLRSIDGFSQALLEDYADKLDDTGRDYLGRLRGASQKMGELIDGLLKLSRLSRSEMRLENVDLSSLAGEIAARLQETQPERKVKFDISRGLTAKGDPQLLRALLENLIGNAWKFTGKVTRAKIEFGAIHNGSQKTFFVKDNGAGFDMSYVDKLFGAFQRLHGVTEFPGTGIGLATVRRIINRHGGTVRAEGEPGQGATFYFTLD